MEDRILNRIAQGKVGIETTHNQVINVADLTKAEINIVNTMSEYLQECQGTDKTIDEFKDRLIEVIAMATGDHIRLSR